MRMRPVRMICHGKFRLVSLVLHSGSCSGNGFLGVMGDGDAGINGLRWLESGNRCGGFPVSEMLSPSSRFVELYLFRYLRTWQLLLLSLRTTRGGSHMRPDLPSGGC